MLIIGNKPIRLFGDKKMAKSGKSFYNDLYLEEDSELTKINQVEAMILKNTFKILLVEDKPQINKINKTMLAASGFKNIVSVTSAEEGWELIQNDPKIRLILSDYRFGEKGEMNGYRLWEKVSRLKNGPKFMIVSGFSDFETRELERAGIPLLAKPYTSKELNKIVSAFYLKHLLKLKVNYEQKGTF